MYMAGTASRGEDTDARLFRKGLECHSTPPPHAARCWGFRELVQVFEQKSAMVRCKVFTVSLAWRRGNRR